MFYEVLKADGKYLGPDGNMQVTGSPGQVIRLERLTDAERLLEEGFVKAHTPKPEPWTDKHGEVHNAEEEPEQEIDFTTPEGEELLSAEAEASPKEPEVGDWVRLRDDPERVGEVTKEFKNGKMAVSFESGGTSNHYPQELEVVA